MTTRIYPWVSLAAAAFMVLGCAAWSHAVSAGDAPPKAAAAANSATSGAKSASAAGADELPAVAAKAAAARRPLDLTAPPVDRVLTPEQVRSFVTEPEEEGDSPEQVTVASPHYLEPVPNGPFLALPWALMHPLQAWRILAPITD